MATKRERRRKRIAELDVRLTKLRSEETKTEGERQKLIDAERADEAAELGKCHAAIGRVVAAALGADPPPQWAPAVVAAVARGLKPAERSSTVGRVPEVLAAALSRAGASAASSTSVPASPAPASGSRPVATSAPAPRRDGPRPVPPAPAARRQAAGPAS